MRLLAIDVGNTRIHYGIFVDGRLTRAGEGRAFPRADAVVAATVAPARLPKGTLLLGRDVPPLTRNRARHPETVGLDRLAQASGAWARCRKSCVAVAMGTAITFNVVDARGDFVGGLIAPGMRLQARALRNGTAQLPEVRPVRAKRAIGRHTREALEAGISLGVEGLLREGLRRIERELGTKPLVFGTGGDAPLFKDLFVEVAPHLALEGLDASYRHA